LENDDDDKDTEKKSIKVETLTKVTLDHKKHMEDKAAPGTGFNLSNFRTKNGKDLASILKGNRGKKTVSYLGGPDGKPQKVSV
jgi:hypothetical protein